VTLWNAVH